MKELEGCYRYGTASLRIKSNEVSFGKNTSHADLLAAASGPSLLYIKPGVILIHKNGIEEFGIDGAKPSYDLITRGLFTPYVSFFTDAGTSVLLKRAEC